MLKISNIKVSVRKEDQNKAIKYQLQYIFKQPIDDFKIIKKSIDARDKIDGVFYVYEVVTKVENENLFLKTNNVVKYTKEEYIIPTNNKELKIRPIVIGFGPAGLFCSYILAKANLNPIVFERGQKIEERTKDVENFWTNNHLNVDSNIQFGEGGAGTFSDGKLNTSLKKSVRQKFVLETFVECGAPEEILYLNKPHIGTDILRNVIKNMRNKIIELGGTINYNSKLTNIKIKNNQIKSVIINDKDEYETDNLIIAIGHSARDTFKMLNNHLKMEPKSVAVGIRVQHDQNSINENQYGEDSKYLPPADYKLTYQTKEGRGVYSFCMCPGGFVVNSSSEKDKLCINGMSNHNRSSKNANSAIVVTVNPHDYGDNIFDGMHFQEELENKAFKEGKGLIPISLLKDYKLNKISLKFGQIDPIFKGGYNFANINNIFPDFINESLKDGIEYFGSKIKGFNNDDVIIAAVESRTSSPIRILRNDYFESNIIGIYPCGEGAGYAGGITSAAIDGIKVAEAIISKD